MHSNLHSIQLILENIAALEAIRRGYNVEVGNI
jgi:hypothetical protein